MKKSLLPTKWMTIASLLWVVSATMVTAQNNPAGNAERGNQFFQTSCALCHSDSLGPGNTVVIKQGPTLVGVMGRNAGASPHFSFTQALKDSGLVWNAETLDHYLTDPTTAVPGTTMSVTVSDASDRADVIAYLAILIVPEGIDLDKLPRVTGLDPDDWQEAVPGAQHYITVADLPPPYATPSVGNFPTVVPQPTNASLAVLPGFTVKLFASGLTNPRIVRV